MSLTFENHNAAIACIKSNKKQLMDKEVYVNYDTPKESRLKEMSIKEGSFQPLPYIDKDSTQRYAVYISGISGSGKSVMAANVATQLRYVRKNAKKQIVLFTTTDTLDPAFEKFLNKKQNEKGYKEEQGFIQINVNNPDFITTMTSTGIDILQKNICIFDDWDAVGKQLFVFIDLLLRQCLEHGRKKEIDIICISHMTMNYVRTKHIIFECSAFVLFPSSNQNSVNKFLKAYLDLSKEQMKIINEWDYNRFSFLYINKGVPRHVITNKHILLI